MSSAKPLQEARVRGTEDETVSEAADKVDGVYAKIRMEVQE